MLLFFGICFSLQNVILQKNEQHPNQPKQNNPPKQYLVVADVKCGSTGLEIACSEGARPTRSLHPAGCLWGHISPAQAGTFTQDITHQIFFWNKFFWQIFFLLFILFCSMSRVSNVVSVFSGVSARRWTLFMNGNTLLVIKTMVWKNSCFKISFFFLPCSQVLRESFWGKQCSWTVLSIICSYQIFLKCMISLLE